MSDESQTAMLTEMGYERPSTVSIDDVLSDMNGQPTVGFDIKYCPEKCRQDKHTY